MKGMPSSFASRFHHRRALHSGLTLVELMVALAVVAILAMLAVPSMTRFVQGNSLSSQTNEVVASLKQARSEAARRGIPVAMTSLSGADFGSAGWTVFTNSLADGDIPDDSSVTEANGTPIRRNEAAPAGITVSRVNLDDSGNYVVPADGGGFVLFNPRGGTASTALFRVCSSSHTSLPGRVVRVNPAGSVSVIPNVSCE